MPENEPVVVRHDDRLPVDPDVPCVGESGRVDAEPVEVGRRPGVLRSHWDVLLVIAAGGALGSLARWGLGELLRSPRDGFPWATFTENISGGLALGMLMVLLLDVWPPHRYLRPFLGVGLLGGYTTFSTYMLESRHLLVAGRTSLAFTYLAGTLLAGLAAVWLGVASARVAVRLAQHRRRRRGAAPFSHAEPPTHRESERRSNP